MRCRITLHLPLEEATRGTERVLLFNTVLQMALKDDVERWEKSTGVGIRLTASQTCASPTTCSSSLLRLCSSKMWCDFKQSTESVGLKIHSDKTKILTNRSTNKRKEVEINNIKVEILSACESAKNLGKKKEIKNRIRAAWASFYRYKTRADITIVLPTTQTRLFNRVIMPTLSLASGTGTLIKKHERMIRSTQRKMLRLVVQTERKYNMKTQPSKNEADEEEEKANHRSSNEGTAEGSISNTDRDQDSDISFMEDTE